MASAQATLPKKLSREAVEIFQKVCFPNYEHPNRIASMLDKGYTRLQDKQKEAAVKFVGATDSEAWKVQFPNGTYTVVSGPKACHVIASQADGPELHAALRRFAARAHEALYKVNVDYKPVYKNGKMENSGFTILDQNERTVFTTVASTFTNKATGKPVGVITLTPQ